jgi:hypothetical protein
MPVIKMQLKVNKFRILSTYFANIVGRALASSVPPTLLREALRAGISQKAGQSATQVPQPMQSL